jgi:hypothetical protein
MVTRPISQSGHLDEHEVVAFQRPPEDGSRMALRGRRCSSPGRDGLTSLNEPLGREHFAELRGEPVEAVLDHRPVRQEREVAGRALFPFRGCRARCSPRSRSPRLCLGGRLRGRPVPRRRSAPVPSRESSPWKPRSAPLVRSRRLSRRGTERPALPRFPARESGYVA